MSKQKITWQDVHDSGQVCNEKYKLSQSEIERQLRKHLDGANTQERRQMYEVFYRKRK